MNIEFKWVGGATWIMKIQGMKIACDPVLCPAGTIQDYKIFKTERLNEPIFTEDDFEEIDLWLITHGHEDHLDDPGLSRIKPGSKVITHKTASGRLRKIENVQPIVLKTGESASLEFKKLKLTVEAMPAVHGTNPFGALLAGGVNGYWMTIKTHEEQLSVYVTSDTVLHSRVVQALQGRNVDLLIPNMGGARSWIGTLTLTAKMLIPIMLIIKPKLCLPVHFGAFSHYVEPISATEKYPDENIVILQPGQTYTGELSSNQDKET